MSAYPNTPEGDIAQWGLTHVQASRYRARLTRMYAEYLRDPVVEITLLRRVAIYGAVLLGNLASQAGPGTVQAVIAGGAAAGADFAGVFRYLFIAGAISLALALVCLILLKELPLRSSKPIAKTSETTAAQ